MLSQEEVIILDREFPKFFRILKTKHDLNAYTGKHILEKIIGRYVSKEEFIEIMTERGFPPNKKNKFRLKAICSSDYFV
jgi:hypothetical protein